MATPDELAEAFPEVPAEKLGRLHDIMDGPTLAEAAAALDNAAGMGKVPEGDYRDRVDGGYLEPQLHPDFKEELEREGLDPEKAEEGIQAEQEAQHENWEEEAKRAADSEHISALMDTYVDLQQRVNQVLQSPTRQDIPDDMEIAASILANELDARIQTVGMGGDPEEIRMFRKELQRVPTAEARQAYLDALRGWLVLAENEGTEASEAKRWVLDADSGPEAAQRIERLTSGSEYDVTTEQLKEIIAVSKEQFA